MVNILIFFVYLLDIIASLKHLKDNFLDVVIVVVDAAVAVVIVVHVVHVVVETADV
jgi:hypothetical protein